MEFPAEFLLLQQSDQLLVGLHFLLLVLAILQFCFCLCHYLIAPVNVLHDLI